MRPITVLIADDEKPAREKLTYFIRNDERFTCIAEAADGETTLRLIKLHQPDVVFLDIQMPEPDGIEIMLALTEPKPLVVFTTAYEQYAIKAFELASLDYLLKPFDSKRFSVTAERIVQQIQSGNEVSNSDKTNNSLISLQLFHDQEKLRITVKHNDRLLVLPLSEISFCEADGNYIRIQHKQSQFLIRKTMNELEGELLPAGFIRVQRSFLVNRFAVKEIHPHFNGDAIIVLHDGKKIPCSKTYRNELQKTFTS